MQSYKDPNAIVTNTLQRAKELERDQHQDRAIDAISEVLANRRIRSALSKNLQDLMVFFVELCVEQRKGKIAKEGLIMFRNMCQQTGVESLGTVIRHFLDLAETRAQQAQEKSAQAILDIADLEAEEAPESLLLGAVSGEDIKGRTDRGIVTPWLKFLWETYRNILDIIRTNAKLEGVYQETAEKAFDFCRKYARRAEFRRLTDILRKHLSDLQRLTPDPRNTNIAVYETQQAHLKTRFKQLQVATELELWQDAYKSIEDIQGLFNISKRPPKASMMATYYEKLSQLFWVSKNLLFHSFACSKLLALQRSQKVLSADELKTMASTAALAALSVPIERKNMTESEQEREREKHLRLATLFGPNTVPSREYLLSDLISRRVFDSVLPELRDLHEILEVDFNPLDMCSRMAPIISFVRGNALIAKYAQALTEATVSNTLAQLSKVYRTMRLQELGSLVAPLGLKLADVETIAVDSVRNGVFAASIDYHNGTITFGSRSGDGGEEIKNGLCTVSRRLETAVLTLLATPEEIAVAKAEKAHFFAEVAAQLESEHQRMLKRKEIIESRKIEETKKAHAKRAAEAAALEEDRQRKILEAKKKQEEEAARIEAAKKLKERQEKERKEKQAMIVGTKVKLSPEELDKLTKEQVAAKIQEAEQAEIDARRQKIIQSFKSVNYMERARRDAERPLLESAYEKFLEEDKKKHASEVEVAREQHIQKHQADLAIKSRLSRMLADREEFLASVMRIREFTYQQEKEEQDRRRAIRRADFQKKQETMRRAAEERRRAEKAEREERERAAEAARKAQEEAEKKREADLDARRKERDAQRQKDEEILRLQREREEAALAKQRLGAAPAPVATSAPSAGGAYRPPGARAATGSGAMPSRPEAGTWRREEPQAPAPERPSTAYRPPGARTAETAEPSRPATSGAYRPPFARDEQPPRREERRDDRAGVFSAFSSSRAPAPASGPRRDYGESRSAAPFGDRPRAEDRRQEAPSAPRSAVPPLQREREAARPAAPSAAPAPSSAEDDGFTAVSSARAKKPVVGKK